jgi:hypothetical protein
VFKIEVHTRGSQLQPELNFYRDPKDVYKGKPKQKRGRKPGQKYNKGPGMIGQ